ncbi:MAG: exopolysaccharide biosynthesis polyprenyl glycosylphosphotransferase [Bacteroidia bacterium]
MKLSRHYFLYFLIIFVYMELFYKFSYDQKKLVLLLGEIYMFLLIWRTLVFFLLKRAQRKTKSKKQVVIAGISVATIHFKEFIDNHPEYGINVQGFFSNKENPKANLLGKISDIVNYCQKNRIDEIIGSVDKLDKETINTLLDYSDNNFVSMKLIPDSTGFFGRNFTTTFIEHIPLLTLNKNPFDDSTNQFLKRSFDVTFSLFVIIFILSWLCPLIALLVKLSSPGPVFFVQERSGIMNKTFRCFKFRTMKFEKDAEFKQATKDDCRVTKIGAFLRRTSLDEVPQFFNVLFGDMSVVGPRPHPLKLTEEYSKIVDKYMMRHLVRPGITGLSQVMGYRGETQHDLYLMKMRVRMDRFYIENWSFYLDLKVVWATILLMFKNDEKAY